MLTNSMFFICPKFLKGLLPVPYDRGCNKHQNGLKKKLEFWKQERLCSVVSICSSEDGIISSSHLVLNISYGFAMTKFLEIPMSKGEMNA